MRTEKQGEIQAAIKRQLPTEKSEQYKSVQDVTAVQRRLTPASLGSLAWGNNKLSFLAAGRPPKNLTIVTFRQNNQNKTNMDQSKVFTNIHCNACLCTIELWFTI